MSGLVLWFKSDDGGEQGFACGRWGVQRERCSAAMGKRLWGVLWAVLTPRLSSGWVWASMSCVPRTILAVLVGMVKSQWRGSL